MDGFKRRLAASLQLRLSLWLSLAILGTALIAGAFSFLAAFREAYEFQDEVLRQVAALLDERHMNVATEQDVNAGADRDRESRVFVQRLGRGSPDGHTDGATLNLPVSLQEGFQTVDAGRESFRVFVKTLHSGERVAFAQQTEVRDEIARHSAFGTLMPFVLLVPLLLLMVADLIRKIFKPIALLSASIDQRNEQELHPLDTTSLPSEIRPFVVAINRLLGRVSQSMQAQQRFVADAAHELRSPLTALSLQAERLAGAEMPDAARERLDALRQGIERGRILLEQLLALARAQSAEGKVAGAVSVHQVFRRVLEDLMPLAEAKHMNVGVASESDVPVPANEADLIMLVSNLLDNAIRYTPEGGRIDLSVHVTDSGTVVQVTDTGPGIPPAERSRVFDPFYRIMDGRSIGSGLGLSIVDTIATRSGANVTLSYSDEHAQSGLCVCVLFPCADAVAMPEPCPSPRINGG